MTRSPALLRPVFFSAVCLLLVAWLGLPLARAEVPVPPVARITDQTGTFTPQGIQSLEQRLAALETAKGSQLAVLIVATTQPETIEQFGLRVAEAWKLGRKGVYDGALLLVAKDDRTLRIEVGYGLEGVIPDAVAKRVIEEIIVPRFREGNFQGGIEAGVDTLIKLVEGEPLPPPAETSGTSMEQDTSGGIVPVVLMFIFIVGGVLRAILGRMGGASVAGALAFLGAWLILGSVVIALIIAIFAFVATLFGGTGRGGGVSSGGGGFGGGGFGGGGFSGGGGGFGGGGASGRW